MIRQNLNSNATQNLSSSYLSAVEGYFSPLFQFMSTATLWTRIGDLESLGTPENYVDSLHQSLEIIGSASAMSLTDAENRELVFRMEQDGEYQWFETTVDADDSLVARRKTLNAEYLNLSDVGDYTTFYGEYPAWFRISTPYSLPGGEGLGSTISATIGSRDSGHAFKLWLDLPSKGLAQWIESAGEFPDAVIFLLLPGDEFLMFTTRQLNALVANNPAAGDEIVPQLSSLDRGLLSQALENSDLTEESGPYKPIFEYNGRLWRADYRNVRVGTQDIKMGVFVPVDSLWTSDVYLPVQVVLVLILIGALLMFIFVVRDFRLNAAKISESDLLRHLINGGESFNLEFKSSLRWDYRQEMLNKNLEEIIMKSIAAFSNSEGGILLIGVDDSGKTLGLEPDYDCLKESGRDYFELHLRSLLISQFGLDTASRGVGISFVAIDGQDVCQIQVSKGIKPLYTTLSSKSGPAVEKLFVRSGNSSRAIISLAEVTSYVVNRFGRRAVE